MLDILYEEKNTHLEHLEDDIINNGADGGDNAINFLSSIKNMLQAKTDKKVNISVKWDGAPAIVCGINPENGKFFVGTKSVFNKTPKINYTIQDIKNNHTGELVNILRECLEYLSVLNIKGIIQGDFLYSKSDVKTQKIKGKSYVTFHPNTIVYAVPGESDAANAIKQSKIGIVWHTTYKGNSFETLKASYGVDVSRFNTTRNVWSQDATLRDLTKLTMSRKDTDEVTSYLSTAGQIFNQISGTTLRTLEKDPELAQLIEQFNNTYVRKGQVIQNTKTHTNRLISWIKQKFQKEADKRKTEKGKSTQIKKLNEILKFFSPANRQSLVKMFDLQKVIVLAKMKLINTLNKLSNVDTFLKTKRGYRVTGQEGYVAIDKLGGDAVKIVDRMEFSYANFSPDILKGWDKPGRN